MGRAGDVGIVVVSHSEHLAAGLVELASQMAPTVRIIAAGGREGSGAEAIGTSFERVTAALERADGGHGVVVLGDLGSAILTAESVLDFLPAESRDRVRIARSPFVEGTVAAAVSAESGGDVDDVAAAARGALDAFEPLQAAPPLAADVYRRTVVLINDEGLHARPAAELVRLAGTFNAHITVNGRDAKSLLGIMSLGLVKGMSAEIASADGQAHEAVDALASLIESGFHAR